MSGSESSPKTVPPSPAQALMERRERVHRGPALTGSKQRGAVGTAPRPLNAWLTCTQDARKTCTECANGIGRGQDARVRMVGLEPTWACAPGLARTLRLPIAPHPHRFDN